MLKIDQFKRKNMGKVLNLGISENMILIKGGLDARGEKKLK